MDVPPHPHTGLQTVSWLFERRGRAPRQRRRARAGAARRAEPDDGAGAGICHSEASSAGHHRPARRPAVGRAARRAPRRRPRLRPLRPGARRSSTARGLRVFLGDLAGSPTPQSQTFTPLLGAEITLEPGTPRCTSRSTPRWSTGCWSTPGPPPALRGTELARGELGLPGAPAATVISVHNPGLRVRGGAILLGGEPFDEEIVMWWQLRRPHPRGHRCLSPDCGKTHDIRFGVVDGYRGSVAAVARASRSRTPHLRPRPNPWRSARRRNCGLGERECGSHRVGNERVGQCSRQPVLGTSTRCSARVRLHRAPTRGTRSPSVR